MKKRKLKKIFTIAISVLLVVGLITACVFIFKPKESKRIYPTYHIGSLDENGFYKESDDSIYSDLFECQGLTVKPDFTSDVEYSIYFYYLDETFAEVKEDLTASFTSPVDESYRYARILINPNKKGKGSDDYKIYFWNVLGISNDLEISVKSKQPKLSNLAEVENEGRTWDTASFEGWNQLKAIDVSEMNTLAIVCEDGVDNVFNSIEFQFNKTSQGTSLLASHGLTSKIITIDVSKEENIYISVKSDLVYKIYKFN